jgi:hypothetical protein
MSGRYYTGVDTALDDLRHTLNGRDGLTKEALEYVGNAADVLAIATIGPAPPDAAVAKIVGAGADVWKFSIPGDSTQHAIDLGAPAAVERAY